MAQTDTSKYEENGRLYGAFRKGQYMLPCDDKERDRLDIMHTLIKVARPSRSRLFHAPMTALPKDYDRPAHLRPRVLDLGCGTGIWLIEMAEEYAGVDYVGVDLTKMTPESMPAEVEIQAPFDFESPWFLGEDSFDFIHLQMALGSVLTWPRLYTKIFDHLKPGTGYFESVEVDWQPHCDDGTLPQGKLVDWWWKYVQPIYEVTGRVLHYNPGTGDELRRVGFVDIGHAAYRLPLNPWPKDNNIHEQRAGMWWGVAMSPGADGNGGYGLQALSLAPLTRVNQWPSDHADRLCRDVLAEAANPNYHAYNVLHVWWARKPHPSEPR